MSEEIKFKVGDDVIYIDASDNPYYKKGPFKSQQVKVEEIINYKFSHFYNLSDGIFHARPCHIFTKEEAQQEFNKWLENERSLYLLESGKKYIFEEL